MPKSRARSGGSNGAAWRSLRAWLRSRGDDCALCGRPIDYSLPAGNPASFEVDHKWPVARWHDGGWASAQACELDRSNVQAVHRACNRAKSDRVPTRIVAPPPGEIATTGDWL